MQKRRFHPEGLSFLTDTTPARWVEDRLAGEFGQLSTILPAVFAAYARLFHPARDRDGQPVRWREVAAWSGRQAHARMAFERISAPRGGAGGGQPPWRDEPLKGSLGFEVAVELAEFLESYTSTAGTCYFAIWEGYGQFNPGGMSILTDRGGQTLFPPEEIQTAPRLAGIGREYLLYAGPLSAVRSTFQGSWNQSANLWWPQDQAWCVCTDIDLDSTFIGGSEECITALLEDARFEVILTRPEARVAMDADTINADE
jgi:hypothetical protein